VKTSKSTAAPVTATITLPSATISFRTLQSNDSRALVDQVSVRCCTRCILAMRIGYLTHCRSAYRLRGFSHRWSSKTLKQNWVQSLLTLPRLTINKLHHPFRFL
jgi:hypothetical protein